jgi:iron complex outermembrane recepter protein
MKSTPTLARRPRRHMIALAAMAMCALPAAAQQQAAKGEQPQTVVVTGIKASAIKAQDMKRDAEQIVDSIVADDIGKLPDANVAEALQRIAGVQISRSRGEGDRVQVRGLSQTVSLLNGRSIFTAGKERGLSFQDVPAELLAGVDVYKTPMANQVEGALGGVIDLRMRRPFDFAGRKVAATLKATNANLAEKTNAEGSFLLSDRWLTGGGEFGALLSVAVQKRAYRMDTQDLGAPAALADGSGVYAPTGSWVSYELGERDRTGMNLSLQYRPAKDVDIYFDASHTQLKNKTDVHGHYASPFWANYNAATGLGQLWPDNLTTSDTQVFQKGTFWGASSSTTGAVSDQDTKTTQLALGANWRSGEWRTTAELSHTDSTYWGRYSELRLGNWDANQYRFDLTTDLPSAYGVFKDGATGAVRDVNLLDPGKYWADKAVYFRQENKGRETVVKFDGSRNLEGTVSRLRAGLRLSDRLATSGEINTLNNIWTDSPGSSITGAVAALDRQIGVIPYSNLLKTAGDGKVVGQWLSLRDLNWLRDESTSRSAVGLTVPSMDLAQTFEFSEKTSAAYGMADFDTSLFGKSVSGNVGVRLVHTADTRRFYAAGSGAPTAASVEDSSTDVLPSLNARMDITSKLVARVAASKVISRPSFDQLTPSLSLNVNDRTGYLGNPLLGALSAHQFDTSIEYYLSPSDHVYGAAFYKKVDGFIQTTTTPYAYQGDTYTLSTPSNGANGTITGAELGYQAFVALPGGAGSLGVQANYTYVDSSAPGPLGGQKTQLQNLSRHSANVVGIFDYQSLSLRLAYNYRSRALAGTGNYYPVGGGIAQTAIYAKAYGMWDLYASYQFSKGMKAAVSVNNLLETKRTTNYGIDNMPKATYADDRRVGLSLHFEL